MFFIGNPKQDKLVHIFSDDEAMEAVLAMAALMMSVSNSEHDKNFFWRTVFQKLIDKMDFLILYLISFV